jgi:hypothetical protein
MYIFDAFEARNKAVFATSAGSPKRPRGSCDDLVSLHSFVKFFKTISVFIGPGAIAFILTPEFPYSYIDKHETPFQHRI